MLISLVFLLLSSLSLEAKDITIDDAPKEDGAIFVVLKEPKK